MKYTPHYSIIHKLSCLAKKIVHFWKNFFVTAYLKGRDAMVYELKSRCQNTVIHLKISYRRNNTMTQKVSNILLSLTYQSEFNVNFSNFCERSTTKRAHNLLRKAVWNASRSAISSWDISYFCSLIALCLRENFDTAECRLCTANYQQKTTCSEEMHRATGNKAIPL